jgi:hypothetical protein
LWIGKQGVIASVGLVDPGDEITLPDAVADKFINGGLADNLHELPDEPKQLEKPKAGRAKNKGV